MALLTTAAYLSFQSGRLKLPVVNTATLDPTVARLVEATLGEVQAAPRSGAAWGKLGSVLMHYEFMEEARRAFDEAAKLSPEDPRWVYLNGLLLMGRHSPDALNKLERATELCPERPDSPRLRLAEFLAEHGRNDEAEAHFQRLLRTTPNHPPALLGLARIRHAQRRLAEGASLLAGCLDDPHAAKAGHALLAMIQLGLGDRAAAAAAGQMSARLPKDQPWPDPWWAEAMVLRVGRKALLDDATTLMDHGRLAEAITTLASINRDYPEDEEAWYLLGWALNQQQRSSEAEAALREQLRRAPESPKGQAQLAVALLGQKRYSEAVEVLQTALRLKPTWRELHSNLGYASVQLARYDEAIRHYRDALECDPNYVAGYTALGELLGRRGDRAEARRVLGKALDLDPSNSRARALIERLEGKP
jgi:tetratricopeptide (TPR) repeat protein